MVKNRILVAVALVASFIGGAIALGVITGAQSAAPGGSSLALSSGDTGSVTCDGQSVSVVPQSPTSLTVDCNSNSTGTTTTSSTAPPSTTDTQPITTTTTTTPTTTTPTTTTTTTRPPSTGQTLLGLWNNGTSASALGVTAQVYSDYAFDPNATTYSAAAAQKANGKLLMLAVGALTPSQATAIGQALVAGGQPDAILRPMWEMNQSSSGWFPSWNENAMSAPTYQATWIAMVNAFRAIPGTDFKFDYNVNAGDNNNALGRATFDSYPGNAYVDYIGLDIYDWYGTLPSFQANLTEVANFAQVMQLPLTIPEWGLANNEDDPAFVNLIHSNCDTSSCYEEGLFAGLSSGPGTVLPASSVAAYRADFG